MDENETYQSVADNILQNEYPIKNYKRYIVEIFFEKFNYRLDREEDAVKKVDYKKVDCKVDCKKDDFKKDNNFAVFTSKKMLLSSMFKLG